MMSRTRNQPRCEQDVSHLIDVLSKLWQERLPCLRRQAFGWRLSEEDVEEALSDLYIKINHAIRSGTYDCTAFSQYSSKALRNVLTDRSRESRRRPRVDDTIEPEVLDRAIGTSGVEEEICDRIEMEVFLRDLGNNLGKIPEHYREVFELRYLQGLPYETIAQMKQMTVAGAKTKFRRATIHLQKCYRPRASTSVAVRHSDRQEINQRKMSKESKSKFFLHTNPPFSTVREMAMAMQEAAKGIRDAPDWTIKSVYCRLCGALSGTNPAEGITLTIIQRTIETRLKRLDRIDELDDWLGLIPSPNRQVMPEVEPSKETYPQTETSWRHSNAPKRVPAGTGFIEEESKVLEGQQQEPDQTVVSLEQPQEIIHRNGSLPGQAESCTTADKATLPELVAGVGELLAKLGPSRLRVIAQLLEDVPNLKSKTLELVVQDYLGD